MSKPLTEGEEARVVAVRLPAKAWAKVQRIAHRQKTRPTTWIREIVQKALDDSNTVR